MCFFDFRPIIIEVPHFASLRGKEREVVVMRSDNGESWYEHPLAATEEAVSDALGGSLEGLDAQGNLVPGSTSMSSLWSEHRLTSPSLVADVCCHCVNRSLKEFHQFPWFFLRPVCPERTSSLGLAGCGAAIINQPSNRGLNMPTSFIKEGLVACAL